MEAEQRHFLGLVDSIRRSREVDLTYWKPGAPGPENRRVRPLHLAHLEHRWILVAEDPGQRAWRNFRVSRIQSFETTERRFQPPGRERIRAYLAGSLGRFTGAERHRVVLRIAKALVPYLKESPWHGTQRLEERPEGTAEVTLELNNLVDVRRRILACGAEVEVVAPEELRRAVASEARALARLYDQKDDLKAEKNDSRTEFVPPALID
jgi:predicted DNA-binding transcriptional regulator YafY